MRKLSGAAVLLIFLATAFCLPVTSAQPSTPETLRVGVLYWSMNIPGQVAMRNGLEAAAERINRHALTAGLPQVELLPQVAGDGQAGIERQIGQMFEMVKQQPDIIVVQPTDNAALSEPLKAANRAGIPVVAYDQYISGGHLAAYVTSNNTQAGYLDGEYIAAMFADSMKIRLVLVEYPHVSSTVERLNGFLNALRDHGQAYQILKTYKAVQPEEGLLAGQAILNDFPEAGSIDVVFTVNDGGGLSVVDVLAKAGRDEIVVASIDGDPESVENIRNNRLTRIDSAQFCGPLGQEAMQIAYAIATHQPASRHVLIPVFPVTKETLQFYPGWLGPIPASFRKPWQANKEVWDGTVQALP